MASTTGRVRELGRVRSASSRLGRERGRRRQSRGRASLPSTGIGPSCSSSGCGRTAREWASCWRFVRRSPSGTTVAFGPKTHRAAAPSFSLSFRSRDDNCAATPRPTYALKRILLVEDDDGHAVVVEHAVRHDGAITQITQVCQRGDGTAVHSVIRAARTRPRPIGRSRTSISLA